jgi:hypothetical protein
VKVEAGWFEVSFERLRRADGGAVITRTDVTARMRAEADGAQPAPATHAPVARRGARPVVGGVRHELKQPLTSILGNAEAALSLLKKGTATSEELSEILNDIVQDDERAAQFIQRLRALLGKGDTQHAPVELNDLVRESLDLIHSEFVTRNVGCKHSSGSCNAHGARRPRADAAGGAEPADECCEAMVATPLARRQACSRRASCPHPKPSRSPCRTTARASRPATRSASSSPSSPQVHGLGLRPRDLPLGRRSTPWRVVGRERPGGRRDFPYQGSHCGGQP